MVIKKRVDFKIRKKTANRKTGRFEFGTANDNFSNEKKTAKKKPMIWPGLKRNRYSAAMPYVCLTGLWER